MFDHGEIALHDSFGDKVYWQARRSMRFNKELKRLADDFRKKYLNSTDNLDNAILPDDWTQERVIFIKFKKLIIDILINSTEEAQKEVPI